MDALGFICVVEGAEGFVDVDLCGADCCDDTGLGSSSQGILQKTGEL